VDSPWETAREEALRHFASVSLTQADINSIFNNLFFFFLQQHRNLRVLFAQREASLPHPVHPRRPRLPTVAERSNLPEKGELSDQTRPTSELPGRNSVSGVV
jgi:hypothetical protein